MSGGCGGFSSDAIAAAVGLITAARNDDAMGPVVLLDGVNVYEVVAALTAVALGLLEALPPAAAEDVMRHLALCGAEQVTLGG